MNNINTNPIVLINNDKESISSLVILNDGRIACGSMSNINIWNIMTTLPFIKNNYKVSGTHLSILDDERIVCSIEEIIIIWNIKTKSIDKLIESNRYINSLIVQDKKIIIASDDITIWNSDTGKCETIINTYNRNKISNPFQIRVLTTLDNTRIVSGSDCGKICIWNIETGKCEQVIISPIMCMKRNRILPGGDASRRIQNKTIWSITALSKLSNGSIVSSSGSTIRISNIDTHDKYKSYREKQYDDIITTLIVIEGDIIVSGFNNGQIRVWNTNTCEKVIGIVESYNNKQKREVISITALAILQDKRIISGSNDGKIRIWKDLYVNKLPNEIIKEKINCFINKYTNTLNEFSKEEIISDKNYVFNNKNKFSRNLVATTNYANQNQYVYNYIVSCSVNKTIIYLGTDNNFFNDRLNKMKNEDGNGNYSKFIKDAIESRSNNIIEEQNKLSYSKIIYILFFYLGIQRQIIYILQQKSILNGYSYQPEQYGLLSIDLFKENSGKFHPITMKRFEIYENRLIYNMYKTLLTKNIRNPIIKNTKYDSIKITAQYLTNKDSNSFKISYLIFFNKKNIKILKNNVTQNPISQTPSNSQNEINKKNYINIDLRFKRDGDRDKLISTEYLGISNNISPDGLLYFLNIMSFCLEELDNKLIKHLTISEIKEYIIIIYYLIIFIMPFRLGTASIAEIFLYSLWKKYVGKNIQINQNVMLDVEALTLPYDLFKKNCFEKDDGEDIKDKNGIKINYTPYLIEV